MATQQYDGQKNWIRMSAAAGMSDMYVLGTGAIRGIAVTVHPGSGGTATLAVSTRSVTDIAAGNADWVDVQFGGATDLSRDEGDDLPIAIQAVKLSATTAPAKAHLSILV